MYALNFGLENAWKNLFSLAAENNPSLRIPSTVLNTIDDEIISSDKTRLSHICGYPLVSQYAGQLEPLCAPHFDIEGVNEAEYFSYFMVKKTMPINSIVESKGLIAAVNTMNSNSGMIVLRHEIEIINKLGVIEQFFKELNISWCFEGSSRSALFNISIKSFESHNGLLLCVTNGGLSVLTERPTTFN